MIEAVIFIAASAGIFAYSRKSLGDPRSHGFYRFFAFEAIIALVLVNIRVWFDDPFSLHQLLSWLLLISSIPLAVHGFHILRAMGEPEGDFERTTKLVIIGAYRYIRHPLYASLLLVAWGIFFKDLSITSGILVIVATIALIATARAEEKENLEKFGNEYREYMTRTGMFIPFLL